MSRIKNDGYFSDHPFKPLDIESNLYLTSNKVGNLDVRVIALIQFKFTRMFWLAAKCHQNNIKLFKQIK